LALNLVQHLYGKGYRRCRHIVRAAAINLGNGRYDILARCYIPNTNGSQFFIMETDYPLPPNYTIFGNVTAGQDVVSAIAKVDRSRANDMPTTPVTFTVKVLN
jgi:hypothetical protein